MPEQVWYRSLYWRIGLGFIACVAGLLVAQAVLFVWLTNPSQGAPGGASPRFAAIVAADISTALDTDPSLDVEKYVRENFGHVTRPIAIFMKDGRTFATHGFTPPPPLARAARFLLERGVFVGRRSGIGRGDDVVDAEGQDPREAAERGRSDSDRQGADRPNNDRQGNDRAGGGRDGDGRGGFRDGRGRPPLFGRIVADDQLIGLVAATPLDGPPWLAALRDHGPMLAVVGIVLLFAGTAAMAFFIFRPAQRRLQNLQRTAAAIGSGETSARAAEQGGDEVAALAQAFNQMAGDLDARVRELHESDRARRQLLADVSHELMTPLTAMRGYLETLGMPEAVRDQADRDRYLQIVMDETLRLESIIGDLLELARLEGGGAPLQLEDVAIEELFARAADRHGAALRDKEITLDTHIAPGAETVHGDGRRLEQALQNLVANAVRHTPRGGRIALSADPAGRDAARERVRLTVRDTGAGIPAEHLPMIFDRFYKVDASREHQAAGSGLGLSIVKAIVERHGGAITASNRSGDPSGASVSAHDAARGAVSGADAAATGAIFEIVLDRGKNRVSSTAASLRAAR
jgi:signal transduction histidine kinase